MIPLTDLKKEAAFFADGLQQAAQEVINSGWYLNGQHLANFEQQFAQWSGAKHCVGVSSGTDALILALLTAGIKPGDEVIIPSLTAVPTAAAVCLSGGVPVFADVDSQSFCLNPETLPELISDQTRFLLPVHLYGRLGPVEQYQSLAHQFNLTLIEDCAQAHGAFAGSQRAGLSGQLGCFSFYPTKNLGAIGDAGAVVTDDPDLSDRLKTLRHFGESKKNQVDFIAPVARMDDLQAACLSVKLAQLDRMIATRRKIADAYLSGITHQDIQLPAKQDGHAWHLFVIQTPPEKRSSLQAHLDKQHIGHAIHYPQGVHHQKPYQHFRSADCAVTDKLTASILSLPMHPWLSDDDVMQVIEALNSW